MRPLMVRRAATVGIIVSVVLAAALGAQSDTPLLTFAGIATLCLLVTLVVTVAAIAINRRNGSSEPPHS